GTIAVPVGQVVEIGVRVDAGDVTDREGYVRAFRYGAGIRHHGGGRDVIDFDDYVAQGGRTRAVDSLHGREVCSRCEILVAGRQDIMGRRVGVEGAVVLEVPIDGHAVQIVHRGGKRSRLPLGDRQVRAQVHYRARAGHADLGSVDLGHVV